MAQNKTNEQIAEIRRMLIEAVAEGLQDKAQRSKASFLGVALGIVKAHGIENAKTPDEVQEAVESLRSTYIGVELPFLRNGQPNPNFKPKEQPAPVVPSVLLDQDDDDSDEDSEF
jgi:hypothetical protein